MKTPDEVRWGEAGIMAEACTEGQGARRQGARQQEARRPCQFARQPSAGGGRSTPRETAGRTRAGHDGEFLAKNPSVGPGYFVRVAGLPSLGPVSIAEPSRFHLWI